MCRTTANTTHRQDVGEHKKHLPLWFENTGNKYQDRCSRDPEVMRFKSHPRNSNVQLILRLVGHFFALHGMEKQMYNAFWFVFIRFCFREMSGERCMEWKYLQKRRRRRTSANVVLWGKGCEWTERIYAIRQSPCRQNHPKVTTKKRTK